jgi:SAM-dependent methyltransferase
VTFDVAADSYDRFMGRYAVPLAPRFGEFAGVQAGQRALDVGCGPGALTAELVRRLGAASVQAVDPSEPFVEAARARNPGVDVRQASAEELPFEDDEFDVALAQLVVHFMSDPVAGVAEMARVTRSGGVVAACVWDLAGERAPLSVFWRAARDLDPGAAGESGFAGAAAGQLTQIFERAGLSGVEEDAIVASVEHDTFDEWWEPYTLGVGPAGAYAKGLDEDARDALRERCRELLPEAPFTIDAYAWAARASV